MMARFLPILVLILLSAGSGCRQEPATSADLPPTDGSADARPAGRDANGPERGDGDGDTAPELPKIVTLSTDDADEWPSYEPDLEITIDAPPVPEHIIGPFSEDDVPPEEDE